MQRRLRLLLWAQGAALSLDDLEHEDIEECEICWQGGEAIDHGTGAWFADAGKLMDSAATARGRPWVHICSCVLKRIKSAA